MKIVIVDDSDFMRNELKEILFSVGVTEVIEYCDGSELFEHYHEIKWDDIFCLIIDSTMPYLNGIKTIKKLNQLNNRVPIVLFSGFQEQLILAAIKLGVRHFIGKPVDEQNVLDSIKKLQ
jgi:FixJ family two-component response regulator